MRRASDGKDPPARREVLWVSAGLFVVLVACGGLFVDAWMAGPTTLSPNGTAAQSNLQNALTGVQTFQASDGGSLIGLMTGSKGASPIQEIGTGLTWTSGASTNKQVISAFVGGDGRYVVLTALGNDPLCFGILHIATRLHSPVFGRTRPGNYFFVAPSGVTCASATVQPVGVSSEGFPNT